MLRANSKKKKYILVITLILVVFPLFLCAQAVSGERPTATGHGETNTSAQVGEHEGGGDNGHAADRSADLLDLLYRFINFALLVIILVWALKKADIKTLLTKRTEEIREKMEALKREKEEAERKYREIENKLKEFENERERIIQEYRRQGESERDRIVAEARDRVRKILEQAEFSIKQEIQSAKERLKEEVVELAAQQAQEIIAKKITEEDQVRLVNDFIERVGKVH
ncbi:MAG: ATP synthase F0 subunit B [Deltaproteobacteria bacterium]|nr:ATP synthase F0 subunit B [Deltaproteobacteria bacterium]